MFQTQVVDLNNLPPVNEVLGEKEQAFYNTLKLPKRKTEWLGGRLALKKLLVAHVGGTLADFEVLTPGGVGKPTVKVGGKEITIPFSITHSNGYAVAAIAPQAKYLGIDLEKVAPRINAWKNTFFLPEELAREDDEFLTSLWTQKEAVVKLLGSGLTINSLDVRIMSGQAQFSGRALEIYNALGRPQITLQTTVLIPGFYFSTALGK
ncbi:MAG: 4'-phosphopantetheinyl transferase superfamily protein [Elusimicrobiaceae bacterium]|nr:4'-phosphopantetheinyl transferase superfamily protein [Elusimicrobiaceae bacterium]